MAIIEPTVAIASIDPEFSPELSMKLASDNCRVIVATDIGQLVERIMEADVHVAVVDLDLSNGDCRRLIEELKKLDRHLGLIVVADHCSQEDEIYLRSSGILYLAFKPAEAEGLAEIVKESARNAAKKRYC